MLKVIDKKHFAKVKNKKLATVYRFSVSEWRCTTPLGGYVYLKYKGGILAATVGMTEYEVGNSVMLLASTIDFEVSGDIFEDVITNKTKGEPKFPPLDFDEIKEFFGWKCEDDQIWDCYV